MPDTSFPLDPRIQQAPETRPRRRLTWLWWLLVVLALGGAAAWWFWPQIQARISGTPATTAAPAGRGGRGGFGGPVPVTVAAAGRRDIPLLLDALGTVQAFNSITIRSQVDGILVEIAFIEGQEVRAGDVLARIDPAHLQRRARPGGGEAPAG